MTVAVAAPELWATDPPKPSSYRKLASKDPLREVPIERLTWSPNPLDDFLQVLREGPLPGRDGFLRKRSRGDILPEGAPSGLLQKLALAPKRPPRDHALAHDPPRRPSSPLAVPTLGPTSPATTADSVREQAAKHGAPAIDVMVWGRHRVLLVAGQSQDEIHEREEGVIRAWKTWSSQCIQTKTVITEHYARTLASAGSRSISAGSTDTPLMTPTDDPLSSPGPAMRSAMRSAIQNGRRLSLAASPTAQPHLVHSGWASGPSTPGWTSDVSPYESALVVEPAAAPTGARRNPLLVLRPRVANRHVKQLLIELAQHLAYSIDARQAPIPTIDDLEGNRRRSDLLAHLTRHHSDAFKGDPAWYTSETEALVTDVDDALGPLREFTQLLYVAQYDLAGDVHGQLQLLVDLEELSWGMAEVPQEHLPGPPV